VIRGGKQARQAYTALHHIHILYDFKLPIHKIEEAAGVFFPSSFCHLEEGVVKRMVVKINDAIILFGEREREKRYCCRNTVHYLNVNNKGGRE